MLIGIGIQGGSTKDPLGLHVWLFLLLYTGLYRSLHKSCFWHADYIAGTLKINVKISMHKTQLQAKYNILSHPDMDYIPSITQSNPESYILP